MEDFSDGYGNSCGSVKALSKRTFVTEPLQDLPVLVVCFKVREVVMVMVMVIKGDRLKRSLSCLLSLPPPLAVQR